MCVYMSFKWISQETLTNSIENNFLQNVPLYMPSLFKNVFQKWSDVTLDPSRT